ncbi:MAG: TadE/TadG family type IV pilus assembly protein [Rubripirellula sp.]|nr:TadE/TadG family type IV pilus assembly protein [Rubripirellula sp.]
MKRRRNSFRRSQQRCKAFPKLYRRSDRTGASIVEFAFVANLLILMILTCMEFARMNMVRNLAQDAAYFAARQAMVPGATTQDAIDEASRIMDSLATSGYTVDVTSVDADAEDIRVTVSVDLTAVALFAPYFLPNTDITTVAHLRTERYDGFYEQ